MYPELNNHVGILLLLLDFHTCIIQPSVALHLAFTMTSSTMFDFVAYSCISVRVNTALQSQVVVRCSLCENSERNMPIL